MLLAFRHATYVTVLCTLLFRDIQEQSSILTQSAVSNVFWHRVHPELETTVPTIKQKISIVTDNPNDTTLTQISMVKHAPQYPYYTTRESMLQQLP